MKDASPWRRDAAGNELTAATFCARLRGSLIGGNRVHGTSRVSHAASLNSHVRQ